MIIEVKSTLGEFSKLVKEKKYKRIEYEFWRKLAKSTCAEIQAQATLSYSEKNPIIIWTGKGKDSDEFYFDYDDNSLGEFLYNKIKTESIADTACSSCSVSVTEYDNLTWSTAKLAHDGYVSSYSPYTISFDVKEDNFSIDGKSISDIVDEATGTSMKRKENDNMNLIKKFDFGSCESDNVKMSMYGVAVKNATGTWVSYDPKSDNVIDVDIFNISGKYLYKVPAALKDIKESDVIIHNRKPMFVTHVEDGKILAIDPAAGEEKVILLTRSPFGFDFVTKIVSLFDNVSGEFKPTADQPFGNPLMLMMLSDNVDTSDLLPFILMGTQGTNFNPLMLLALDDKNKNDSLLPLLFFSQNFGQSK